MGHVRHHGATMLWKSACRGLVRRPAFALSAILILALGISATTTLFSLVDAVLWKPLPYPEPDRLVMVYEANAARNQNTSLVAPVRLDDWNRLSQSFSGISGWYSENVTDTSGLEPERLAGNRVAPRFFSVYGTPPLRGRVFTPDEEAFGGPAVAVISYHFWQRRYHGDASIIGRGLVLGGKGYAIVGVMPDAFAPPSIDLWMPAQLSPWLMAQRDARFYRGVGRMKPGVTPAEAQAELSRVQAELGRQFPATDEGWSAQVRDLKGFRVGQYRASLSLMFAAVVLLLIIACANAGGLMLGQLHWRERELVVRSALGASRPQLIAVVLREVTVLVGCGAALGLTLSIGGVAALRQAFPGLPRVDEVRLDWRALVLTGLASLLATAVCGLAPALQTLRAELAGRLFQSTRPQVGGRRWFQGVLVGSQFAVTLVLLLAGGLLVRSYAKLSRVDPGFDAAHVLTFHIGAEWGEDRPMIGALQERLLAELERLPGVTAAGMTSFLPATGATLRYEYLLQGSRGVMEPQKILGGQRTIGGRYLQAMGMALLQGEMCPERRTDLNAPVQVIVNRHFAGRYGGGAPILGRRLSLAERPSFNARIVGVVADAKEDGLGAPPFPYVYMCLSLGAWPDPEYVVRTTGEPRQILGAIRDVARNVAPGRAVFSVKTLEEHLDTSLDTPRLSTEVLVLFAGTALVLAAVGLYGLVALAVTSRTKEIGVRVALGADPRRIVRGVMVEAARPVAAGLACGGLLAAIAVRGTPIRSVLFGVSLTDAVTIAAVVILLALVAAIAAILPARRASAVDPISALREQ